MDSDQVAAKMRDVPTNAHGFLQLLSLAWGVVLSTSGPDDVQCEWASLYCLKLHSEFLMHMMLRD